MSNIGFAGVTDYAMTTTATAVRTMGVTGVGSSSETVQGPSLGLNFLTGPTGGPVLDPRITFTRASNATVTNSDGTIGYAPHNMLTYSEQFDNAQWVKGASCVVTANAATAPDGTSTADFVVSSGTTAGANTIRNLQTTSDPNGSTYTFSVWLRADAPTTTTIRCANAADGDGGQQTVNVGTTWQRFSVSCTFTVTSTGVRGAINYQSSAVSVYVWGAQLNVGALQPYYTTTVKNLLGFTQEFDNAAWTKSNSSISATKVTAPDGSLTGQKLVENTANTIHSMNQSAGFTAGAVYTASLYVKQAEAGRFLQIVLPSAAFGTNFRATFNVVNGTSVNSSGTPSASSIQAVGGGWYRCSFSLRATITATAPITLALANSSAASLAAISYLGDGTSGILIWGAQLSDSASLDQYVYNPGAAPTAAAYYGPRFDYDPVTLAPKGLLIEEQRTNSIRNNMMVGAVAGTPGTLPTNWSLGGVGALSQEVVGIGVENGINYIDIRLFGTTTSTSCGVRFESATSVAVSSGQTWTVSTYCRMVGGSTANISTVNLNIAGLTSGGAGTTDTGNTSLLPFLSEASLRSTRASRALTFADATTAFARSQVVAGFSVGAAIDITLRIGLPQLEQGAFATSVIPTTTAAATRAADVAVMTGANFSNWYRADEGSFYAQYSRLSANAAGNQIPLMASDGTGANIIAITDGVNGSADRVLINTNNVSQMNTGSISYTANQILARSIGVKTDDCATAVNGGNLATDNTVTLPVVNQLNIGYAPYFSSSRINGHIRKIAYYPHRLANSELQAITA